MELPGLPHVSRRNLNTGEFEDFKLTPTRIPAGYLDVNPIGATIAASGWPIASELGPTGNGRGTLSEPFDIMNHFGNFGPSMFLGSAAACTTLMFLAPHRQGESSLGDWLRGSKRTKRLVYAIATTVGLAMNGLAESPVGMEFHYDNAEKNYVDKIDFAYGVAGTILGCRLSVRDRRDAN